MADAKNFELYFVVELLKADNREFRQDSDQLLPTPNLKVCVLLPRENEYVYNLSDISTKELSGEVSPDPILTPKGLAYVKKQLEQAFVTPKVESESWDGVVETEKKLNLQPSDGWGNEEEVSESNPFKGAESETWSDEKEEW